MPLPPQAPPPRRGLAAARAPGSGLALLQGGLLVVAVLYFARDLLIPLVLAVLLSFVLAPVVRGLRRVHVPRVAAELLAVLLAAAVVLGVGALLARQGTLLAGNMPTYRAAIAQKLSGLQSAGGVVDRITAAVQELGQEIRRPEAAAGPPGDSPGPAPPSADPVRRATQPPVPVEIREPDPTPLETLQRVVEPLLHPLATTGIVAILVVFILLYREDLRDRLIRLAGARDLHRTMAAMDDAAYRLSRFFLAQVAMNAAFGTFIAATLWLIGIPNPLLWGFVAGLMRFVPFLGAFIAAAFPALLALAVDPGWTTLVLVLLLFAVSEAAMGQVVEPLLFGQSTGLSPIAVIAAATFWTWLWGPVGLLLAVPLTVCLVVLGRHVDRLEFLEVMLGDQPALDPKETFYQRALAGDSDALAEQAEACLREKGLAEYLDAVAIPALRLGQADLARDAVAPERVEAVHRSVLTLIEDLEEAEERKPDAPAGTPDAASGGPEAAAAPPPAWRAPGAVLCVAGRGPFDAVLAAMLAQVLVRRGFGVQTGGGGGVTAAGDGGGGPGTPPPRLACLCLVEGGGSAATARYLLRRTRRRLPGVPVLALAWQGEEEASSVAAGLRAEGTAAGPEAAALVLATSLAEAAELASEAAAAAPGPAAAPSAEEGLTPEPDLAATAPA